MVKRRYDTPPEKKKFAGKTYTRMASYSPGTPKRVLDEAKGVLRRGNCSARTVKTKKGYTYLYIAKK